MGLINVTVPELRKAANELRAKNGAFKTQVGKLEENEALLKSQWEGEANDAFHNAFMNDKAQFDNFYNLIEQYAVVLENIASQYEKAENANTQTASTRTY